jgi:multimeric flavodoxin WrbA
VLILSTTAMDDVNPRFSTSDALLEHALDRARRRGADTRYIKLRDLKFRHCEGNYSKAAHACTWPCAITERDPEDQLTPVYEGLVHWADVVLIGTPIRWGNASSLYYKMIERLNCVQNQVTIHNTVLIKNKVAAFIITGGQDNIQAVAGSMFTFWAELGFVFPPFPFIAHSRGWDAEDMQNNVRQVKMSDTLREASSELLDRALDFWTIIDKHKTEMDKPMERAGRKANTLPNQTRPRRRPSYEPSPGARQGLREGPVRGRSRRGGKAVSRRHRLLGGWRAAHWGRVAGAGAGARRPVEPRAGVGRGRLGLRGRVA